MNETKDLLQDVRGRLKWMGSFPEDYVRQLADRIEELELTLKPFAKKLTDLEDDGDYPEIGTKSSIEININPAWLRAARKALKGTAP